MDSTSHRSKWTLVVHGGAMIEESLVENNNRACRSGLQTSLDAGRSILRAGGAALDAVQAAVSALEDNPAFNAGRGSVMRQGGSFELDACLMDGATGDSGAVAAVTRIANPIHAARCVLRDGRHRLLAGPGADQFALNIGCQSVSPEYFIDHHQPERSHRVSLGTVGAVAMDNRGNLAAGTSTGGVTRALPGRVGDSPIVGAGTYAENNVLAVSATGFGERFLRHSAAAQAAWMVKYLSLSAQQAIEAVMDEVLPAESGGMIGIGCDGEIIMHATTRIMRRGWATSDGDEGTALVF
ncbi:isoaspartyl peptidase/L-asparaginase [Rhodopirellula sallentina]|uniref:Isoaspartyl peptidase n=1 Tax=Rhodopirellula sallentina SM41 TaxID=1263870 RepID=M5UDH5_9BACT|nr:isoaspartyl peptidase/L-asparaginase [Rhodopirellula sallentina]EMI54053.1 asparaginase family protein [Rhodopirellula sallentina SM41]